MRTRFLVGALVPTVFGLLAGCSDERSIFYNPILDESGCQSCSAEQAFPGETGIYERGFFMGQEIYYKRINGMNVWQGDIFIRDDDIEKNPALAKGQSAYQTNRKWPNNIVYYDVNPSLPSQGRVTDAIAHWEANTNLRFVLRTSQSNYIYFTPGEGCGSYVGMIGGRQDITLASECLTPETIHEIGHAVGHWHEHSRSDRDKHVRIHWENIGLDTLGKLANFGTFAQNGVSTGVDGGSFDFGSIMIYGSYFFSKNNKPTITKLDGSTWNAQRNGLSSGDIAGNKANYPTMWSFVGRTAMDVDAGANGPVHIIGTETASAGRIYKWTGSGWHIYPTGAALKVAVEPNGTPWVLTSANTIHRWNGTDWITIQGSARDIDIGANGSVHIIGTETETAGRIYRWTGSGWHRYGTGAALKIAVEPNGTPWVITSSNTIHRWNGSSWIQIDGSARDIDVSADGTIVAVSTSATAGGFRMMVRSNNIWKFLPDGGATIISAGNQENLWCINNSKQLIN